MQWWISDPILQVVLLDRERERERRNRLLQELPLLGPPVVEACETNRCYAPSYGWNDEGRYERISSLPLLGRPGKSLIDTM